MLTLTLVTSTLPILPPYMSLTALYTDGQVTSSLSMHRGTPYPHHHRCTTLLCSYTVAFVVSHSSGYRMHRIVYSVIIDTHRHGSTSMASSTGGGGTFSAASSPSVVGGTRGRYSTSAWHSEGCRGKGDLICLLFISSSRAGEIHTSEAGSDSSGSPSESSSEVTTIPVGKLSSVQLNVCGRGATHDLSRVHTTWRWTSGRLVWAVRAALHRV